MYDDETKHFKIISCQMSPADAQIEIIFMISCKRTVCVFLITSYNIKQKVFKHETCAIFNQHWSVR